MHNAADLQVWKADFLTHLGQKPGQFQSGQVTLKDLSIVKLSFYLFMYLLNLERGAKGSDARAGFSGLLFLHSFHEQQ